MHRQRVNLALGPGLFEVRSALKVLDEMNKMAMPILFMCRSANRAGISLSPPHVLLKLSEFSDSARAHAN